MSFARFRVPTMMAMKPPNVAIHSVDNTDQNVIRGALRKCLTPDRYSFIRLDEAAIHRQDPWMDNVDLVVICGEKSNASLSPSLSSSSSSPSYRTLAIGQTRINYDRTFDAFLNHWQRGGKFLDISTSLNLVVGLVSRYTDNAAAAVAVISTAERKQQASAVSLKSTDSGFGPTPPSLILNEQLVCIREGDITGLRSSITTEDGIVVVGTVTSPSSSSSSPSSSSGENDEAGAGVVLFSQARFNEETAESNLPFWRHLFTTRLGMNCCAASPELAISSPRITPSYLIASSKEHWRAFNDAILPHVRAGGILGASKLAMITDTFDPDLFNLDNHKIPLVVSPKDNDAGCFDRHAYFQNLKSTELGRVVIFGAILPSTMDIIEGSVAPHGLVVIAGRQSCGRGRTDNVWLSPEGCAMFSVHIRMSLKSQIGRRPSFVQHLTGMAAVEAIRTIPGGYKDLNLRLKWPNDIYYGSTAKIGGIFVQSSLIDGKLHFNVGCGLNVNNGNPTVCVNEILRTNLPSLPELKCEEVIARTLTRLERLLDLFNDQDFGVHDILDQYYRLWLHGDAEVNVRFANGMANDNDHEIITKKAIVRGIDADGFLLVSLISDNGEDCRTLYSVQPDGNSFDMMHNLVIVRNSPDTLMAKT